MKLSLHKYSYLAFLVLPLLFMPSFVQAFSIQETLYGMIVSSLGSFVAMFGRLLDYAVVNFVIQFAQSFETTGVGYQVNEIWKSVRDIFNMTFIFGLVYIGFKMILNSDDSNTRKLLIKLIMAALLVNFSLFFTKAIIEVSNILAGSIASSGFAMDDAGFPSISATFMNITGLVTILKFEDVGTGAAWGFILGTAILFIVSIFVFAAGAFMLIIRYAALLLYMIFSPFMFIGWVFPQLQKYTDQYWSGFLGRAFFAPLYILFVYIALTVIGTFYADTAATEGTAPLAGAFSSSGQTAYTSFASTMPPFILSIVMMLAAVVVSSKLSADGAGAAMKIGDKATKWGRRKVQNGVNRTGRTAGRAAVGTAKFATSQTLGRGARNLSNRASYKIDGALNRMKSSNNSVVRNIGTNKVVDSVGKKTTSTLRNAKFGMSTTKEGARAETNKIENQANVLNGVLASQRTIKNEKATSEDKAAASNTLAASVKRMSTQEKSALTNSQLLSPEVAEHLTDTDIKEFVGSGRLTVEQSKQLKETRDTQTFADVFDTLSGDTKVAAKDLNDALSKLAGTIASFSDERLSGLGIKEGATGGLSDPRIAKNLSEKQITSLRESGKYDASQMEEIVTAQKTGLASVTSGTYEGIINTDKRGVTEDEFKAEVAEKQRAALMTGNAQRTGELPPSVFTSANMTKHITPQALEQRMKNGLTPEDRKTIQENIDSLPTEEKKKWVKWSNNSNAAASSNFNFTEAIQQTQEQTQEQRFAAAADKFADELDTTNK